MSLGELISAKSDLDSEPEDYERCFESDDCFLQIVCRKTENLPEDHFIKPFIPDKVSNLGEIHFIPDCKATEDPSKRTKFLYIGVNAIKEYLEELKTNPLINYDFIYGRTDPQMASVARWVGFTAVEPKEREMSGSVILYAKPEDIKETFEKRKKDGTIDKIVNRYKRLYSTGGDDGN